MSAFAGCGHAAAGALGSNGPGGDIARSDALRMQVQSHFHTTSIALIFPPIARQGSVDRARIYVAAKAHGLAVPQSILLSADEVIE